jgi:uncharacterized phiE125 gp8 family phage protein
MIIGRKLVTAPSVPVLGLQEVKDHLRVDHAFEDAYIDAIARAAEEWAEDVTGLSLITQTWDFTYPCFLPEVEVPRPPLQSIASITYIDSTGVSQLLAVEKYQVDTTGLVGRIRPAFNEIWPSTRSDYNAVTVRAVCGYGSGVGDVPQSIKQAMMLVCAELYRRREDAVIGDTVRQVPLAAEKLAARYKVNWF